MNIIVGISNRHVHLTQDVYEKLFNEKLEKERDLDQPEQFAAKQKITIKNEYGKLENVRIVGPLREYNQIEISRTDSHVLKVNPPVRTSGDLEDSLPITIIGPKGTVNLNNGLIIADRHIHLTKEDIKKYDLQNIKKVAIKINGEKSGILTNVHLKIADKSNLRLHLDSDDGNAFNLKTGDKVELLKIKEDEK